MNFLVIPDIVVLGNTLRTWMIAGGIAVLVLAALIVLRRLACRYYQRMAQTAVTELAELPLKVVTHTTMIFMLIISMSIGVSYLTTTQQVSAWLQRIVTVTVFWQIGVWLSVTALEWLLLKRKRSAEDKAAQGTLTILGAVVPAVVWVIVVLLALDNLGVNITTLVAGLGIGGVAIALAVQNILGDLLASLSIAFDKPFVVGDFVIVDAFMGSVEYIGMKSTRLRSLSGEQIIMSNADLLKSRLRNYGRMHDRRIQFNISVQYETPREKLQAIPEIITAIVKSQQQIQFDRCHLSLLGPSSIDFECVYIVLTADYNAYMDIQQNIFLQIHEAFEREQIRFAYPTQRMFIEPLTQSVAPTAEKAPVRAARAG